MRLSDCSLRPGGHLTSGGSLPVGCGAAADGKSGIWADPDSPGERQCHRGENSSADQKADHADQHTGKSAPCGGVYLLSEAMHGVACQKYRAQGAEYIAPADARYLFGPAGNALRGTIQLANRSPAAGGRTYTALRRSCLCREDERVLPDLSAGCRFVARPCQGGGGVSESGRCNLTGAAAFWRQDAGLSIPSQQTGENGR